MGSGLFEETKVEGALKSTPEEASEQWVLRSMTVGGENWLAFWP
jgi:hypothetical protein